jgi:hypothetical protein
MFWTPILTLLGVGVAAAVSNVQKYSAAGSSFYQRQQILTKTDG